MWPNPAKGQLALKIEQFKKVWYLMRRQLLQDRYSLHGVFRVLISFHLLLLVTDLSLFQYEAHVRLWRIHVQLAIHPRKLRVTRAWELQRTDQRVTQLHLQREKQYSNEKPRQKECINIVIIIITNDTAEIRTWRHFRWSAFVAMATISDKSLGTLAQFQ